MVLFEVNNFKKIFFQLNFHFQGTPCDNGKICLNGKCIQGNSTQLEVLSFDQCSQSPCLNGATCT